MTNPNHLITMLQPYECVWMNGEMVLINKDDGLAIATIHRPKDFGTMLGQNGNHRWNSALDWAAKCLKKAKWQREELPTAFDNVLARLLKPE